MVPSSPAADSTSVAPANGDPAPAPCRVGVISDTHGLLDPRLVDVFRGVSHIIHAGDIGGPEVLEGLARLAPVTAVRGNTDQGAFGWDLPDEALCEACGVRFLVAHDRGSLLRSLDVGAVGADIVVTGHSHAPAVEWRDSVLFLNPGAAGRRRFHLPKAVAVVEIRHEGEGAERIQPRIVVLEAGSSPG